jgi:hypothetical protein
MVGGFAALVMASHERLRLRVDALEKRLAQRKWHERGNPLGRLSRPRNLADLALRQADQARTDFAAIEDGLEFIMAQMSKVPTRREVRGLVFRPAT